MQLDEILEEVVIMEIHLFLGTKVVVMLSSQFSTSHLKPMHGW